MDTYFMKQITCHKMHHPDREYLYANWENDIRELIQLELSYKTTTIG